MPLWTVYRKPTRDSSNRRSRRLHDANGSIASEHWRHALLSGSSAVCWYAAPCGRRGTEALIRVTFTRSCHVFDIGDHVAEYITRLWYANVYDSTIRVSHAERARYVSRDRNWDGHATGKPTIAAEECEKLLLGFLVFHYRFSIHFYEWLFSYHSSYLPVWKSYWINYYNQLIYFNGNQGITILLLEC